MLDLFREKLMFDILMIVVGLLFLEIVNFLIFKKLKNVNIYVVWKRWDLYKLV